MVRRACWHALRWCLDVGIAVWWAPEDALFQGFFRLFGFWHVECIAASRSADGLCLPAKGGLRAARKGNAMKTMLQAAVAAGLLVAGGAACAGDLTSAVTLTSDDDWR